MGFIVVFSDLIVTKGKYLRNGRHNCGFISHGNIFRWENLGNRLVHYCELDSNGITLRWDMNLGNRFLLNSIELFEVLFDRSESMKDGRFLP